MPKTPDELHIGYLISQYPATSHTFISREVAAVRQLGVKLDTFSIRSPSSAELQDSATRAAATSTFTVLQQPIRRFVGAHLGTILSQPSPYLRTLALALEHRPPGVRGFALSLAHFAEAILLAQELKRRTISHLHNHFANSAATVGYLACRLLGLPWSFTIHGISETDYPAGLLLGRKIEAAEFVVCVSYFGRAQAMRLVRPDQWSKLHVVRCGLRLDALPNHAPTSDRKRIISVGRLSPEKGQAGLIEAFAALASDRPDVELIFVGDGPEATELFISAQKLSISERVHFAGRLGENDTLDAIACSDILVLPSFMEGLPIVLMEAMAIGTTVIASRVAGVPELVNDRVSGLLFTPSQWNELAAHLRELINNEDLRKELAKAGRSKVVDEFDVQKSAQDLRALFGSRETE